MQRNPAFDFTTLALINLSYTVSNEADEQRPGNMLALDRHLSGFDFTGLPENINCFVLAGGAVNARWRRNVCHGANMGVVALSDGSVHLFNDAKLIPAILSSQTDDGTLQFYFP
jgi:hypothetical protein